MSSSKLQEPGSKAIGQASRNGTPDSSSNGNGIVGADRNSTRKDSTSQTKTTAFNADDFVTKARARFGGSWRAGSAGSVLGYFPSKLGGTSVRCTVCVITASFNDPQGRIIIGRKIEMSAAGFRVIGTTEEVTALIAWPDENHPVVPWLRETLQLEPVTGPKTRQEFMNESKE